MNLNDFPIHDAEFISVSVVPADGNLLVRTSVRLHEDEVQALQEMGFSGRDYTITFERCWYYAATFYGHYAGNELVDRWNIGGKEEAAIKLNAVGCSPKQSVVFHEWVLSGGSKIELIAERVVIEESAGAGATEI